MELNIGSLVYLLFRLAPFIIVSYFTLSSVFNQDFRGFVYLIGLVLACGLCLLIGKILPDPLEGKSVEQRMKCSALTLGKNGPLSNLPLSQAVFGFTLAYLTYFIATNNLASVNIPMFVFMSVVIVADMLWHIYNSCNEPKSLGLSLIVGGGVGVGWASFVEIYAPTVAYYSGVDKNTCSRPSKSLYRCRATKTPNGASTSP
jgi:hypothetical protein